VSAAAAAALGRRLGPDVWSIGYLAATRLASRAWKSVTNPDKPEHAAFQALDPMLFGTEAIAEADVHALVKAILDLGRPDSISVA
jgi:uncharacterized protein